MSFASEVLARLEIRSRDLAEQTRQARMLRRRADADARSRSLAAARLGREFRGPLTRIAASVQGLQWGNEDRQAVQDLQAAADTIDHLIRRFAEIAERGRAGPSLGPVSLAPLLDQVASQLRWWLEDREISCQIRIAEPEPGALKAHADDGWLEEALWNVAWLVVRGAQRNATVECTASARDGNVQVVVQDPGGKPSTGTRAYVKRGMSDEPEEDVDPLVEDREPHGSARELATAKELIGGMGGTLTADVGDPEGLRITLTLPAAVA